MKNSNLLRKAGKQAFSLVEVVLAMGVIAFALVPLVYLLPLGLATFHDSTETTLSAQTREEILNNLKQASIYNLLNQSSTYLQTNYFDDEGNLLGTALPLPGGVAPVYQVKVTVSTYYPGASSTPSLSVPSSGTTGSTMTNAVLVTTQFSRYQGASTAASTLTTFRVNSDYLYYNAFNQ